MANSIIDDFKIDGLWAKSKIVHGKRKRTLSYAKWDSIQQRCRTGGDYQTRNPTYIGCSISEEFKDFQTFATWHTQQIGYGLGYDLDKDILMEGNKIYSEDSCVLVPHGLNSFLCSNIGCRGNLPQGVFWNKYASKFEVKLRVSGKKKYIGVYSDLEAAKLVYKEAKEAEAYRWYERLKSEEFVVDERVIERMRVWRFNG